MAKVYGADGKLHGRPADPGCESRDGLTPFRDTPSFAATVSTEEALRLHPVRLFCWHFMAYPYLPSDFDARYDSGWVTVPNTLWDRDRAGDLYQEYIDQLVYADELGFDGMVLNEHHQNIYGLMPSPNIVAAALTQRTKHGKIVVLGNLLPLHRHPLRVAEEYAMIDNMSGGRLIAGLAIGGGPEAFNYNVPQPQARGQFWEAVDLIKRLGPSPARSSTMENIIRCAMSICGRSPASGRIRQSGFRRAQHRNHGGNRQTRARLFPLLARPWTRDPAGRPTLWRDYPAIWRRIPSIPHGASDLGLRVGERRTGAQRSLARVSGISSRTRSRAISATKAGC